MSERFFVACPLAEGPVAIDGAEAHHMAQVCRVRAGDGVCLFNGDGRQYPAVVVAASKRSVELDVQRAEQPARELAFALEAAVPLPKGDRAQFLVEKLTELGVTRLVPLRTARSVVHPGESKHDKMERWVIEASKQCGRNVLMTIAPLTDWAAYAAQSTSQRRLIAHPAAAANSLGCFASTPTATTFAVGPEGGFTADELALAEQHGWLPVGLGPRILRVETAALALAALATTAAAS